MLFYFSSSILSHLRRGLCVTTFSERKDKVQDQLNCFKERSCNVITAPDALSSAQQRTELAFIAKLNIFPKSVRGPML